MSWIIDKGRHLDTENVDLRLTDKMSRWIMSSIGKQKQNWTSSVDSHFGRKQTTKAAQQRLLARKINRVYPTEVGGQLVA
jgi:hypothetical protein